MLRPSSLTDERLASLYTADGFGGETTMRATVIRELIDEIRCRDRRHRGLREELASSRRTRLPSRPVLVGLLGNE